MNEPSFHLSLYWQKLHDVFAKNQCLVHDIVVVYTIVLYVRHLQPEQRTNTNLSTDICLF